MQKKQIGRPPKPKELHRTEMIPVYVSKIEKELIELGIKGSLSTYIRNLVLKDLGLLESET